MPLPFVKMQACGNDFVVLDDLTARVPLIPNSDKQLEAQLAIKLCDRRFGVGADQLIWLKQSSDKKVDSDVFFYNTDGMEAEMCGNGLRAVARYLNRLKPEQTLFTLKTLAGIQTAQVLKDGMITVVMGVPEFKTTPESITVFGESLEFYRGSIGNPHAVFFVDHVDAIDLVKLGPVIEHHETFPQKTNVEFVEVINSHRLKMRVWERSAGITLACGSGATVLAAIAVALQKVKGSLIEVELPGGNVQIEWNGVGTPAKLIGPAEFSFEGTFLG